MNKPFTITVMTRLYSPNIGIQALATELIQFLEREYPDARIYAGYREPGLEGYSYKRLQREGQDPIVTLNKWVKHMLRIYHSSRSGNTNARRDRQGTQLYKVSYRRSSPSGFFKLAPYPVYSLPQRCMNKAVRIYKSFLNRFTGYGRVAKPWFDVLYDSDLVIYSPGGEINDWEADSILRDFLQIRIAQELGARVIAINHSVEVNNPSLLEFISQFYSSLDAVLVRDPYSVDILKKSQVPLHIVNFASDTALLTRKETVGEDRAKEIIKQEKIVPDTVGICARYEQNVDYYGWSKVIQQLRSMGKEILYVSNQMIDDKDLSKQFFKRFGVRSLSRQYDYNEFTFILSLFDLTISERYHTCIFSAVAQKPFIPLSIWGERKMSGLSQLFQYAVQEIDDNRIGWHNNLIETIKNVYGNYEDIVGQLRKSVLQQKNHTEREILYIINNLDVSKNYC